MKSILALTVLAIPALVAPHKQPKTPEEIEMQRGLQAAAYYVRHFMFQRICISDLFILVRTVCTSSVRYSSCKRKKKTPLHLLLTFYY
jgi:hypothetical protein